ncbi:MAG: rhomboid family intramembrane serine protease [Devosia sp.]|uniref:rhomboid family intramembrane serine protease n=1 Tax=Devosia sp. TaxID=1871048 RepID=UPI001A3B26A2|nr:rhomboid family intramembrane serine protease [Devosia sp.]MBL8599019.1 rhomboid family intramembrane serine protease [Devosia sp.]
MSDDNKTKQKQQVTTAPERQPIFNLPAAVAAIAGLFLAIQALQSFVLNESIRNEVLVWLAFIPYRLIENAAAPGGIWPLFWTPFTHAFLHAGWEHVIFNTVWFVIFGTPIARRYGAAKLLILFLLSALAGAAAFAVTTLPQFALLVGASGGVAGLTGAAVRFIFQPIQVGIDPETGERIVLGRRLATIGEVLRHPTARIFAIVWIVLNGIVPLLPMFMPGMAVEIAWQAHIGGFLFGFFAIPLFERRQP